MSIIYPNPNTNQNPTYPSYDRRPPSNYNPGEIEGNGYTFDPVKNRYIPSWASMPNQNAMYDRMTDMMNGLMGSAKGSMDGTGGGGGGMARLPPIEMPNMDEANNAIYAKAKDAIGQQSRAALTSLSDEMAGRGIAPGSGMEAGGMRDVVQHGQGQLGQVSRDIATLRANQALDLGKMGYQGGIAQRGQDIGLQESQMANQRQILMGLMSALGNNFDFNYSASTQY